MCESERFGCGETAGAAFQIRLGVVVSNISDYGGVQSSAHRSFWLKGCREGVPQLEKEQRKAVEQVTQLTCPYSNRPLSSHPTEFTVATKQLRIA